MYSREGLRMDENQCCTTVSTCAHAMARRSDTVVSNHISREWFACHTFYHAHPIFLCSREIYFLYEGIVRVGA